MIGWIIRLDTLYSSTSGTHYYTELMPYSCEAYDNRPPPSRVFPLAFMSAIASEQTYSLWTTVKTRINGPCTRALDLPLLVWSGVFFFFLGLEGADFWCVFDPFSRGANFGLHSTRTIYSSSYDNALFMPKLLFFSSINNWHYLEHSHLLQTIARQIANPYNGSPDIDFLSIHRLSLDLSSGPAQS